MKQTEEHYIEVYETITRLVRSRRTSCAPLVSYANGYLGLEFDDIIHEVMVEYMTYGSFDPEKGPLVSYLIKLIRWKLMVMLKEAQRQKRIPREKLHSLEELMEKAGDSVFVKSDGRKKTKGRHE